MTEKHRCFGNEEHGKKQNKKIQHERKLNLSQIIIQRRNCIIFWPENWPGHMPAQLQTCCAEAPRRHTVPPAHGAPPEETLISESLIEAYFKYNKIHPFQMQNSIILFCSIFYSVSIFTDCTTIINLISEYFNHPKKKPYAIYSHSHSLPKSYSPTYPRCSHR